MAACFLPLDLLKLIARRDFFNPVMKFSSVFHLSLLEEIGLVQSAWKEGKKFYSLKDRKIAQFLAERKPIPESLMPKPSHEIVLDMWEDMKMRLKSIEKKIDELGEAKED